MQSSSSRQANMNKENASTANQEEPTVRITRSRAKAIGTLGRCLPPRNPPHNAPSKQDHKQVVGSKSKRAESDDGKAGFCPNAGIQHKRRAVLKDVTNVCGGNSHPNCVNSVEVKGKQVTKSFAKSNAEMAVDVSMEISPVEEDMKTKLVEKLSKIRMVEPQDSALPPNLEPKSKSLHHNTGEGSLADHRVARSVDLMEPARLLTINKEENSCKKTESSSVVDIDSNLSDPQVCSLYAPDIYNNIRVTELGHRSSNNYMEVVQRDITPSMRGILIDWLVEVSEEYTLVPDTLYLTVNLIDRFLSLNYMEKQRLQLLGVSCMLIASKYEEICAPRVEEFCFITDNTYTKGEVLEMESRVLNFMYFQLSVPTIKTFLRRYIHAAQASDKVPCVELEFLANYLAELTLIDYNFLKFLPSLIAASAVFLARWTLSQSDHPWNPTLEHYTSYKVSEMKVTVLALEDLQLNTNGCTLNAIREKYRQPKFKCVSSLAPPSKRVSTIF